jgi:hypothetical protein
MSRAEQLCYSINNHEGTMNESIDPGPSIETEQYIIPFWIMSSEDVRCRDCARKAIADYINNGNSWTFTVEYRVGVMALSPNKDISIPGGEHISTKAAVSMPDEAVTQGSETQSVESTREAATLVGNRLKNRRESRNLGQC